MHHVDMLLQCNVAAQHLIADITGHKVFLILMHLLVHIELPLLGKGLPTMAANKQPPRVPRLHVVLAVAVTGKRFAALHPEKRVEKDILLLIN